MDVTITFKDNTEESHPDCHAVYINHDDDAVSFYQDSEDGKRIETNSFSSLDISHYYIQDEVDRELVEAVSDLLRVARPAFKNTPYKEALDRLRHLILERNWGR